ncbi:MAG: helix-turn-helix domain-containing protein [Mycobacteriales bacterium]
MLLLRLDDVVELLALSRSTVQRLIVNGLLPSVAVGRSRRVARSQLEQFVADLAAGRVSVEPRLAGRKPQP